jgi:hypothetical protein
MRKDNKLFKCYLEFDSKFWEVCELRCEVMITLMYQKVRPIVSQHNSIRWVITSNIMETPTSIGNPNPLLVNKETRNFLLR